MKSRPLVVYLSKSLKVEEKVLQEVRDQLISCGFKIQEYTGGSYSPELRKSADFTVVVPYLPTLESSPRKWWTNVGKGQFEEVRGACYDNQPCFVYMGHENDEVMMTKCEEDYDCHAINNSNDWKLAYGTIQSYVFGNKPVPLYDFITGYMETSHSIRHRNLHKEFPRTYDESFRFNINLLLLN